MNDRIAGSSYDNPVWYGEWRIFVGEPQYGSQFAYQYVHDDFDGAEDANDHRCGHAPTIDECKAEIDEYEAEQQTLSNPSRLRIDDHVNAREDLGKRQLDAVRRMRGER
jgi:hypothetical protein